MKALLVLIGLALIVAAAAMGQGQTQRLAAAGAAPVSDWITLRPDQFILPPEEFPYEGWAVSLDRAEGPKTWRRNFTSTAMTGVRTEVLVTVHTRTGDIE